MARYLSLSIVAAIPVSQSLAGAELKHSDSADREEQRCLRLRWTHKMIGKATIVRNKDGSVSVKYSLHGAEPTGTTVLLLGFAGLWT